MTPSGCTDRIEIAETATDATSGLRADLLFVTRKWSPAVGGMETYSLKLSEELKSLANVTVVALPGKADGGAPKIASVLLFGLRTGARVLFGRKTFDVVHVGDMSSWPIAAAARLRSRKTRIALSAHGTDVAYSDRRGPLPWLYGAYMRLGAATVGKNTVVANSHATAEKVRSFGFRTVSVVPLATDMVSALDHRTEPRDGRRILFAGRLEVRKGCKWFIENILPNLPKDVTLDVAGTVWDEGEEEALSTPRVRYLGALPQEDLRRAYADADCVVVPNLPIEGSGFEGFGLVAAEAASAGGLVLASAHTGLKDAVLDGVTGLSLAPGDVDAWTTAVLDILSWPDEKRSAFVRNAAAVAKTHFSWSRVAESTFEAYDWAN